MRTSIENSLKYPDELDLALIREMEQDARISYQALASKVGTSPQTAGRRVSRLIDKGIVRIAAVPDYTVLGYNTILILAINTPPGTVDTSVRQLISINSIKYLYVTAGRYDILAVALYRSLEEYMSSLQEEIGGIVDNVRIETMLSAKVIKIGWSHLSNSGTIATHADFIPTDLELSVMRELGKSPRVPVNELAHNIGASLPSVRSSLRKLISQGIIRIVSVTDPAAFGYTVMGVTLIQVHPSKLEALTNQLKANPSVKQIVLIVGAFNCMIWTSFQNSDQMHHFLVQDLGNMPGVVHYESLIILRTQKASFDLLNEN